MPDELKKWLKHRAIENAKARTRRFFGGWKRVGNGMWPTGTGFRERRKGVEAGNRVDCGHPVP
ncbi:hypothetical protein JCM17961_50760 [Endothiovibrio diazotrophicus]